MSEEDFESDQANFPCKSPNSISNNFDTISSLRCKRLVRG